MNYRMTVRVWQGAVEAFELWWRWVQSCTKSSMEPFAGAPDCSCSMKSAEKLRSPSVESSAWTLIDKCWSSKERQSLGWLKARPQRLECLQSSRVNYMYIYTSKQFKTYSGTCHYRSRSVPLKTGNPIKMLHQNHYHINCINWNMDWTCSISVRWHNNSPYKL